MSSDTLPYRVFVAMTSPVEVEMNSSFAPAGLGGEASVSTSALNSPGSLVPRSDGTPSSVFRVRDPAADVEMSGSGASVEVGLSDLRSLAVTRVSADQAARNLQSADFSSTQRVVEDLNLPELADRPTPTVQEIAAFLRRLKQQVIGP